jgi:hypothetical protein
MGAWKPSHWDEEDDPEKGSAGAPPYGIKETDDDNVKTQYNLE